MATFIPHDSRQLQKDQTWEGGSIVIQYDQFDFARTWAQSDKLAGLFSVSVRGPYSLDHMDEVEFEFHFSDPDAAVHFRLMFDGKVFTGSTI